MSEPKKDEGKSAAKWIYHIEAGYLNRKARKRDMREKRKNQNGNVRRHQK